MILCVVLRGANEDDLSSSVMICEDVNNEYGNPVLLVFSVPLTAYVSRIVGSVGILTSTAVRSCAGEVYGSLPFSWYHQLFMAHLKACPET